MGDIAMLALGPGTLYTAAEGTAFPTDLTMAWPTGWLTAGFTLEGSKFAHAYTLEPVEVAELLEPADVEVTGRTGTVTFALAEMTATHLLWLFNGGTVTVGGDGSRLVVPPALDALTKRMWGFQSRDGQERWVWKRTINGGTAELERRKGANKAVLPFEI